MILDVPASWVQFDLTEIHSLAAQLIPASQREDPHRFMPGDITRRSGKQWSSYVSRIRPSGWSLLDVIAAGAPISAQAEASVATFMFENLSGQSDPLGALSSLGIPSFNDLCIASHFAGIGNSLVHVPGGGRLQISDSFDPPRNGIRSLESDLRGSLGSLPANLSDLRFPEHLLLSNSVRIQLLSVQASWRVSLRHPLLGIFHGYSVSSP